MGKQVWKPGNMLYPLPVVMISVRDRDGQDNIITVAWAGTVCTNPPMVSVSVRPERHSYRMIKESGEFVINLVTEQLVKAADYCGVRSGRDVDKFKEMRLEKAEAEKIHAPMILNSPVNIECKVRNVQELGSHHMFLAEVSAWTTKRERGNDYKLNTATWSQEMDTFQQLFVGKTVDEVDAWFEKYCSDVNGRPLTAESAQEGDQEKYAALTDEEKQQLADVTSSATMSLKDNHGDLLAALRKAWEMAQK